MSAAAEKRVHLWERDPDNWYVEPVWVSERLFEVECFHGRVFDSCAGMGHVVEGGKLAGVHVDGFDKTDRGHPSVMHGYDFLSDEWLPGIWKVENIVSNPPYGRRTGAVEGRARLEEEFLRLALERTTGKVALFLDCNWMNGAARGKWLETLPLYRVYLVGPRPSCPPGHLVQAGEKPGNGTKDYAWYVFLHGFEGAPTIHWLRRDG